MKIVLSLLGLVSMLLLTAPAGAQQVAASTVTVTGVQSPAKQPSGRKTAAAQNQAGKKELSRGDQFEEEGAVMIDDRNDEDYSGRFADNESAAAAEPEERAVPGGMPASYGQLKGTLNDGGRSLLVFENEDGTISFVQIFAGKNAVSWKLVSRIYRSAD